MRLYFVLRPQVDRSSTASYSSRATVFRPTTFSHSAAVLFAVALILVQFFDLASHRFQFGFACAAFPFYFSSSLELFGLFFIHNNTVKSCFQGYVLSSPKILYFFLEKKAVNTVSGLFSQSDQFLLQSIYQGQNSDAARMRTAVDAYI